MTVAVAVQSFATRTIVKTVKDSVRQCKESAIDHRWKFVIGS